MGCAVIWSYVELFGSRHLRQAVFVDQAPLQNRTDDWTLGSKGCYDAETLKNLQHQLDKDLASIADGNAAGCLSLPLPPEVLQSLKQETLLCNPKALGLLMADHTALVRAGRALVVVSLLTSVSAAASGVGRMQCHGQEQLQLWVLELVACLS